MECGRDKIRIDARGGATSDVGQALSLSAPHFQWGVLSALKQSADAHVTKGTHWSLWSTLLVLGSWRCMYEIDGTSSMLELKTRELWEKTHPTKSGVQTG
jgi:hypothetical protein